jgi:hypothetical protein
MPRLGLDLAPAYGWRVMTTLGRYAWASPMTMVGLALVGVGLATGGRASVVSGVVEAHGGAIRRGLRRLPVGSGGASALTLGHVVLGSDSAALQRSRPHERVHVAQYEKWGPLFPFAYAASSLSALFGGDSAYSGNRFEKEADRLSKPW